MNLNRDQFLSLLPFIAGFLILCGACKALVFYAFFGISIAAFFDLSEYLTQFLGNILAIGLLVVLEVAFIFLFNVYRKPAKPNQNSKGFHIGLVFLSSALIIWIFPLLFERTTYWINAALIMTILLAVFYGLMEIIYHLRKRSLIDNFGIVLLSLSVIYITILSAWGFYDANSLRYKPRRRNEVAIYMNDSSVVSSTNKLIFLGLTKNYAFMYNIDSMSTRIVSLSDLKEIIIK
jgi:hypothetical protein